MLDGAHKYNLQKLDNHPFIFILICTFHKTIYVFLYYLHNVGQCMSLIHHNALTYTTPFRNKNKEYKFLSWWKQNTTLSTYVAARSLSFLISQYMADATQTSGHPASMLSKSWTSLFNSEWSDFERSNKAYSSILVTQYWSTCRACASDNELW